MHRFANPARFLRMANVACPWLAVLSALSLGAGLYFALAASPADYQQGESVRIMYIHVPSAWMGMFCYSALAMFSATSLIWKHPLADLLGRATAPVGAVLAGALSQVIGAPATVGLGGSACPDESGEAARSSGGGDAERPAMPG